MKAYQIKLKIKSGTLTPFQADTLFGHLCWVVAYQGQERPQEFLKPFKEGDPPFILSDGFPTDYLPRPFSAEFNTKDQKSAREIKKVEWVTQEDFDRIRRGEDFVPEQPEQIEEKDVISSTSVHNTVNRQTNTTPAEGGVYSIQEVFIPEISIYFKVISDEWKDKVVELVKIVSKTGYGKKKSIGKGQFSVADVTEYTFEDLKDADGFVTLSSFCPAEEDPTEGLYKTFVKYGKLGEEFTFCGNPFKRPLLMIKTGSVFKTDGSPKEFYGRIVQDGIAPAKPEVVQYAYAFAVPIVYPKV